MPPLLTVLICTHDRVALLEKVLQSLNGCKRLQAGMVKILVVANACQDGTHAALDAYCERADREGLLPLTWIAEPTPGKSHALNRGVAKLRSSWVAIVDDDHRVSEDFLVAIAQSINDQPAATLLCGRILPDWDGREPDWVHDSGRYKIYPLPIPRQDFGARPKELDASGPIPGGGNQIIQVDLLERLGAFSVDLGPQGHDLGGGEDTEYVLRALRSGERLWYMPEIVQYHYVDLDRLSLRYLMRKAYERSASSIVLHMPEGSRTRGVPRHLYRKVASYLAGAATAIGSARRRFYLVRTAAALGEMAGYKRVGRRRVAVERDTTVRPDHV